MKIFKKYKVFSKKAIAIVLGVILLIAGSGYKYYKVTKDKDINSDLVTRERKYEVKRGDITAGTDGKGVLKFEQVSQSFQEDMKISEIFVKVGQRINEGEEIASISTEYIDEKLKELNSQLKELNENKPIEASETPLKSQINKLKKEIEKLNTVKKSPILYAKTSGIVFELGYGEDAIVKSDTPVVKIAEDKKVFAEITVDQSNITKIEKGQDAYILVSAYEDEKFTGKVTFINLKPNKEGGSTTYSATVELDDNEVELLDGMTVSAQFIVKELKDVLVLSNKAITLKDGKQMVKLRHEDDTLEEVEITTGFSDGKSSEILSGLKEGDTVVIGGK